MRLRLYKSIQACRAAAALLVVLYHLGGSLAAGKYFALPIIAVPFHFGHAGVAFFFVLSGFIIVFVHRQDFFKPGKFRTYFWKRAIRIFPAYWILFTAAYLFALASPALRSTVPHDPFVIVKSLLLLPQDPAVAGGTGAPVIIVAWSLQYEMFFYACIGLIILGRVPAAIAAAALLLNILPGAHSGSFLHQFFSSNLLVLFCLGAGTAFLCMSKVRLKHPMFVALAGAGTFLAVGVIEILLMQAPSPVIDSLIPYGLASGVIIFGLVQCEDRGMKIADRKWIQLLGASSYTLYLLHFPLISVLVKACIAAGLTGVAGAVVSYTIILVVCIGSAVVFYSVIEKPILDFLSGVMRLRSAPKIV